MQHPDDFLTGLHQDHPDALGRIAAAIARAWGDDAKPGDVLDSLAIDAPDTAALVRQTLGDRG